MLALVCCLASLELLLATQPRPEVWTLRQELKIGSLDGDAALTLVSSIVLDKSGERLFVAQPREATIKVFDARNGAYERTIGRRGAGPGEFQFLGRMGRKHDTLYVVEPRLSRVSLFTSAGHHIRTERIALQPAAGVRIAGAPSALGPGDAVWTEAGAAPDNSGRGGIKSVPITIASRDGRNQRLVAQRRASAAIATTVGSGIAVFSQPFAWADRIEYSADGSALVLAAQPEGEPYQFVITRIASTGDTVFSRAFRYQPARIPPAVRDSINDTFAKGFSSRAGATEASEAVRRSVRIPEFLPPVSALLLTDGGDTWVQREKAGKSSAQWMVLDGAGNWKAVVNAPADLSIMAVRGSSVWAATVSEDGLPLVLRYRLMM